MLLQQQRCTRSVSLRCHATPAAGGKRLPLPPLPAEKPDAAYLHGDVRLRQFSWLKDPSRRKANVLHYLKSEDTYAKQVLAQLGADKLLKQLLPVVEASYNTHLWQELQRPEMLTQDRRWPAQAAPTSGFQYVVTGTASLENAAGTSGDQMYWRRLPDVEPASNGEFNTHGSSSSSATEPNTRPSSSSGQATITNCSCRSSSGSSRQSNHTETQSVLLLDEASMRQSIPGFSLLHFIPSPDFAFTAYTYSSTASSTSTGGSCLLVQVLDATTGLLLGAPMLVAHAKQACSFAWVPDRNTLVCVDSSGKRLMQLDANTGWSPELMYRDPAGHGLQLVTHLLQAGPVVLLQLMSPGGWCVDALLLSGLTDPLGSALAQASTVPSSAPNRSPTETTPALAWDPTGSSSASARIVSNAGMGDSQPDLRWAQVLPSNVKGHFSVHAIKDRGLLFACHDCCSPPRCSFRFWDSESIHAASRAAASGASPSPAAAVSGSRPPTGTAGSNSYECNSANTLDTESFQLLLQTDPGMVIQRMQVIDDRLDTTLLVLLSRTPSPSDASNAPQQLTLQHLELHLAPDNNSPRSDSAEQSSSHSSSSSSSSHGSGGGTTNSADTDMEAATSGDTAHSISNAAIPAAAASHMNAVSTGSSNTPAPTQTFVSQQGPGSCISPCSAQLRCLHSCDFTLPLPYNHIEDMVWMNPPPPVQPSRHPTTAQQGVAQHLSHATAHLTGSSASATLTTPAAVHLPPMIPLSDSRPSATLSDSAQHDPFPVVQLHYSSALHSARSLVVDMSRPPVKPPAAGVDSTDERHLACDWLWATASDGTAVPISIVYDRRKVQLGITPAPLLLSCYGAYGAVENMTFNPSTLHWLERGWIWASVHARGGGLLGPAWHAAGQRGNKHVGIGDVICCAEHLVELGMTTSQLLCAEAGSAGGWVVGAALNRAPHLFRAAVLTVPSLDVMAVMVEDEYMVHELGDPQDRAEYFAAKAWSPAENVGRRASESSGTVTSRATRGPDVLVRVALYDQDVPFWDPATYVAMARVRSARAKGQPKSESNVGRFNNPELVKPTQQQAQALPASSGSGLLLMQVSLGDHRAYGTALGDASKMAFLSSCL